MDGIKVGLIGGSGLGLALSSQTERSRHNFAFPPHERMPLPIVHALARIKGAAARVNGAHGLDAGLADALDAAAEAVIAGRYDDQFPLAI